MGGTYAITATFTGIDGTPTSTDVHILHNSDALFEAIVDDYQIPHTFSTTRSITAGDRIDFLVGFGPNDDYIADTTALDVRITQQGAAPCTLHVAPSVTEGTLTLDVQLGTQAPATWNVWLIAQTEVTPLVSAALPVIAPPASVELDLPFFPALGTVGVLTTLTTPDTGIICSAFTTVDSGPPLAASVPLQELVAPHAVKLHDQLRQQHIR